MQAPHDFPCTDRAHDSSSAGRGSDSSNMHVCIYTYIDRKKGHGEDQRGHGEQKIGHGEQKRGHREQTRGHGEQTRSHIEQKKEPGDPKFS